MANRIEIDAPTLSPDVPIVLLASACWEVNTPVNVHHIARRFAAAGHRVLFVESTGLRTPSVKSLHDRARVVKRVARWCRGARDVDEHLTVLSPLSLPANWPAAPRLNARWLGAAVRRAVKRFDRLPILWAFLPGYHRIADRVPHHLLVYHCVDDYAANPGVDGAAVRIDEQQILKRADLVLASSRPLAERLRRVRDDTHLLENVADVERFAPAVEADLPEPDDLAEIARPRAVYIGNLAAYRFDGQLVSQVARQLPAVQFILIGPSGVGDVDAAAAQWQALDELPNVHLFGPRRHEDLPSYLAHCDVGLIPFLNTGHTRSSFPLKLWEMLGAGLPVVTTELPALRGVAAPEMVVAASTADAFARAIEARTGRAHRDRKARLAFARQHDWSKRIEHLRSLLGKALGEDRPQAG